MKARPGGELELRVSYVDLCQLGTGPTLENVLPVTGPQGEVEHGTWISGEDALLAWGESAAGDDPPSG